MRVALISAPWALFNRPSIQLGALKAFVNRAEPDVEVRTCNLFFKAALAIDPEVYRQIASSPWAAEALYSPMLFPEQQEQARSLFYTRLPAMPRGTFSRLGQALRRVQQDWLAGTGIAGLGLAGFSVCFSQLLPSLVLARELKDRCPGLPVVFGGSSCSSALGRSLLDTFDFIDYVISGEGELPLLQLIRHLRHGGPLRHPAILGRAAGRRAAPAIPQAPDQIPDLAALPLPDFEEYFTEVRSSALDFIPQIPLEFSRGCWWNRCTFCNLNHQWHGYRAKSSAQVRRELDFLSRRHGALDFFFTDNALPPKEAGLLFSDLARDARDFSFFGEIRPLREQDQYALYHRGGLNSAQIGIEALSDSLLGRMAKGTTVMDNVAAMRRAAECGLRLEGNLIMEFPGSSDQDVAQTLRVLDAVRPYPALQTSTFFLGHGSPVWADPGKYGIKAVVSHPSNRRLYPKAILDRLEMLTMGYRGDRAEQRKRWRPVRDRVASWQAFHRRPRRLPPLTYREGGTFLLIRQEQPDGPVLHHRLKGRSREIYLACLSPVSRKELLARFNQVKEEQLFGFLEELVRKQLLFTHADHCLALAIAAPAPCR